MDKALENILVCDVGGTNVRFGIVNITNSGRAHVSHFVKIQGPEQESFEILLQNYLQKIPVKPSQASLGFAGPKTGGSITMHSRGWTITEQDIQTQFGFKKTLINHDFAAMTRAIPVLAPEDFIMISEGKPIPDHPTLVAGPGTGFGTAILFKTRSGWEVVSGEGGYMAYPPQTPEEYEIVDILKKKHAFISLELIASGRGMDDVHEAICERHGVPYVRQEPAVLLEKARNDDVIALELCRVRSAAIMGAMGDLVAVHGARGGAVIAGGIGERLLEFLKQENALQRFYNRDRLSSYIEEIPIKILINPEAPLIGAALLFQDKFA